MNFSQYDNRDVNKLGLYGYEYIDYYWTEDNRYAYFIEADGKLAGSVMINDYPEAPERETDFTLCEFFNARRVEHICLAHATITRFEY